MILSHAWKPLANRSRLLSTQSRPLLGLFSREDNDDPEIIEKELLKYTAGKVPVYVPSSPGWDEKLATDSEAVVKAERDRERSMTEMQNITILAIKQEEEYDREVSLSERLVVVRRQFKFLPRFKPDYGPG